MGGSVGFLSAAQEEALKAFVGATDAQDQVRYEERTF